MNKEQDCKIPFDDMITTIDENEIYECCSKWGNTFATITEEDVEALRKGKILYVNDGEYCHFIKLEK